MDDPRRHFDRFELKYLLAWEAAEQLKQDLRHHLKPDVHGDGNGTYVLSSLYYDTDDYRFYWEKIDGIRFRRKLRIRHYEQQAPLTPRTPVFVEIKQRLDRVIQKRRALLPYGDALELCDDRGVPPHRQPTGR